MENQNMGSFGAPIGDTSALVEAMQRRGMDTSAIQATSAGSAPGAPPISNTPPPSEVSMAGAAIQGQPGVPTAPGVPAEAPTAPQNPELMTAISALGGFIETEGKTRRDLVKARSQGLV